MKTHYLKILPEFYIPAAAENKPFELRKNDRDYQRGDKLILQEYDGTNLTGREIHAYVTYLLEGFLGLKSGYCILGIKIIDIKK